MYVKQLEGIVEAAKGNHVREGDKNTKVLSILVPPLKPVNAFGFNYHDTKQNTQEWFDLRIGKVTCSIIGNLIGLAGEKEHLHYLFCVKNKIDPNKVNPKKFARFTRGRQFEGEAVEAFVIATKLPVTSCVFLPS